MLFQDDEFVVYKTAQVKIRYVVKFCLPEDQIKPFQPGTGVELVKDNSEPESQCHVQNESKKYFLFVLLACFQSSLNIYQNAF